MGKIIVALSGGKASAWCAGWAFRAYPKSKIVMYFNDTRWEHPDLYRFMADLSQYFDHPITNDSDGRSPEQLFNDHHAIANNRMPFCSRILKAERLHKYYQDGDVIVFGIGVDEAHREDRIEAMYLKIGAKRNAWADLRFPLVENQVHREEIDRWLESTGIRQPALYEYGFEHNNCSGGCVRAGKGQWVHLYYTLPEVYADRERMEREFIRRFAYRATILKDESLEELRHRIESGQLGRYYDRIVGAARECVGICNLEN
jgi:3'-phosphoadenosine 5'-phosphosulfate sulfotransferase (PAPS reductase)/FAD synthetase